MREASHAGSWYTDSKSQLNTQLDGWLNAVAAPVTCIGPRSINVQQTETPVAGARMIIAPYVDTLLLRTAQDRSLSRVLGMRATRTLGQRLPGLISCGMSLRREWFVRFLLCSFEQTSLGSLCRICR